VSLLAMVLFDEPGSDRSAQDLALRATVIVWWYTVVADATRRAGCRPGAMTATARSRVLPTMRFTFASCSKEVEEFVELARATAQATRGVALLANLDRATLAERARSE
jgi:hypothetical protein